LNGTHDATNDSNQTINQPLVDEGATATLKAKRVTDGHSALIKRHAVVLPLVHPDDKYTDDLAFKDFGSAAAEKDYPDDGTISNKLPTTSRSDEGGAGSLGQKHDEIDLKVRPELHFLLNQGNSG
jgi:hypothetical protein